MLYDRLRVDSMGCCRTPLYVQVIYNSAARCKAAKLQSWASQVACWNQQLNPGKCHIATHMTEGHQALNRNSTSPLPSGPNSQPVRTSARLRFSRIAAFASPSAPCITLGNSTRFSRGIRPALRRLRHGHRIYRMHLLLHAARLLRQSPSTMREAGPMSSWQAPCTVNEACKPSPSAKLPTTVPGPPALTGSIGSASDKVEVCPARGQQERGLSGLRSLADV
jgi:hypothetical protein